MRGWSERGECGERGERAEGRLWICEGGEGNALSPSRYSAFVPLAILEGGERGL